MKKFIFLLAFMLTTCLSFAQVQPICESPSGDQIIYENPNDGKFYLATIQDNAVINYQVISAGRKAVKCQEWNEIVDQFSGGDDTTEFTLDDVNNNPPTDAYTVCKGGVGMEQIKYSPSTGKYYYYQWVHVPMMPNSYQWVEIPQETKQSKCSEWAELSDE